MPRKPKRGCAYPGCPRLTDGQYCEEHKKIKDREYNRYERSSDIHKKYGRCWKRIRDDKDANSIKYDEIKEKIIHRTVQQ